MRERRGKIKGGRERERERERERGGRDGQNKWKTGEEE